MPTMRINDAELYYEEHGSGAHAIVLVHGFFLSSKIWRASYLTRLPSDYRAYAIDMRGHGRSSRTTKGCNLVQLANDVYRWSQRLGIARSARISPPKGSKVAIQKPNIHLSRLMWQSERSVPISSLSTANCASACANCCSRLTSACANRCSSLASNRWKFSSFRGAV